MDDDVLDAFSVDIAIDSVYKTPIFKVAAGQSSCPWEPNTAKREGVLLECPSGATRPDVPANEPAVFKFVLGNTSSTLETWTYAFTAGPESNPHGAKIFCNGAPMNQIQWYAIPYGTSLPVTVTVERGPVEYNYKDLEIVLYSACEDQRANDLGILPDTASLLYSAVYVSAFFIRPCSEVVINEPEQNFVIFPDPETEGPDIVKKVVVSGYNTDPKFKSMSLQYRRSNGDGTWKAFPGLSEKYNPKWEKRDSIVGPYDTLSRRNYDFFDWNTLGFNDGDYEIRAVTNCSGDASDKPGYSEIIKGKIDRSPPALVGVPQPSDGVYHVGDEISFTFNQEINCQKFMQQQLGSASLKNTETNTTITIDRYCVGNKIILDPTFNNEEFENKILRAELFNIEDLTGNKNPYIEWEFYVDRNELAWLSDSIELTKYVDESKTITAKIHNRGGYPVPFSIESIPDWVHVTPDRGTLVANEIQEIQFRVDSLVPIGWLSDSIILHTETGLNPFFMGGDEVLNVSARVICRPPVWVLNPSGFDPSDFSFSMNFTVQLDIEGEMSTDKEDIVGAYVNGELRGIAKIQYNAALNKHIAFLTVYSNVATGETIDFQIWDASLCRLFANAKQTFNFVADGVFGNPQVAVILETDRKLLRRIFIHPGWNWISMNLSLLDPTVGAALQSLTNPDGGHIKGQTDFSAYSSSAQQWFGSLNAISPNSLYQLKTLAVDSILMIGAPIESSQSIPVNSGWNWIGYLPQYTLPIDYALSSLTPTNGDFIKSQLHFAQYVNGYGWIGNLHFLSAPNGYLMRLASSGTLLYPPIPSNITSGPSAESKRIYTADEPTKTEIDKTAPEAMPYSYWQVDPSKFEFSMNTIGIVVKDSGTGNILQDGDEVGAFVGNEIRGSGKAIFIPSINSYMLFLTIYANKDGELLNFKFFDASESREFDLQEKTAFKINSIWGNVDVPQPLHISLTTSTEDLSEEDGNVSVYPNPFTNTFTIKLKSDLAENVRIGFKDVHGKEVDYKLVRLKSGTNVIDWNVKANLPGGVYFISIGGSKEGYIQKVLYLK